jgi:hypothetical protein
MGARCLLVSHGRLGSKRIRLAVTSDRRWMGDCTGEQMEALESRKGKGGELPRGANAGTARTGPFRGDSSPEAVYSLAATGRRALTVGPEAR